MGDGNTIGEGQEIQMEIDVTKEDADILHNSIIKAYSLLAEIDDFGELGVEISKSILDNFRTGNFESIGNFRFCLEKAELDNEKVQNLIEVLKQLEAKYSDNGKQAITLTIGTYRYKFMKGLTGMDGSLQEQIDISQLSLQKQEEVQSALKGFFKNRKQQPKEDPEEEKHREELLSCFQVVECDYRNVFKRSSIQSVDIFFADCKNKDKKICLPNIFSELEKFIEDGTVDGEKESISNLMQKLIQLQMKYKYGSELIGVKKTLH